MQSHELAPRPARGRVTWIDGWSVRLGDVTTRGRLRLDALARYLQDAATEDSERAGVTAHGSSEHAWVMRRLSVEVGDLPRYRDAIGVVTWCSGLGARWAERRTDIEVDGVVVVRAAALWVHIDAASGRPQPLPAGFVEVYGEAAGDREVSQRLRLAAPTAHASRRPWPLRRRDFDVLGHMNNAAYLEPVEDLLESRAHHNRRIARVDVEWRGGIEPGEDVELAVVDHAGELRSWLLVADEPRAACWLTMRS